MAGVDYAHHAQRFGPLDAPLPRHHLVWLSAQGWEQARATLAAAQAALCVRWQQADWPVLVRRQDADAADTDLCLGLAAPPDALRDGAKVRIALRVACTSVSATRAPLGLRDDLAALLAAAWPDWRAGLQQLAAAQQELAFSVIGSLAMQALTGLPYLRPGSDIDVLFYPRSPAELARGVALLHAHAALLPLDGEMIFPSGQAVAWKEWWQVWQGRHCSSGAQGQVLVKDRTGVYLSPVAQLLAGLEAQA
jgi:phosphoribosyl-dephospho-CoA transferase